MAIKNPELDPIRTAIPDPVNVDHRGFLGAVGQVAEAVMTHNTEKTLSRFRNEITGIYEDEIGNAVETQVNALSAQDQAFVGDFSGTMSRIDRITQQGGLGARSRALIQAETALRAAQKAKPRLATQLRQEAALVLGADPTGSTLEILDNLAAERASNVKSEYDSMLKHAREDLGIPFNIAPGTDEFANMFFHLDNQWTNRKRLENLYKDAEAMDQATGGTQRTARVWLDNTTGTFQALTNPLSSVASILANATPQERLNYLNDQVEINGQTYSEFKNTMDQRMVMVEADLAGFQPAVKTQLTSSVAALRTRYDDFFKSVSDPQKDVSILKAINDLETTEWYSGMAATQRYQLFLVGQLKPALEVMAKSSLPSMGVVGVERMIKHILGSSIFPNDDPTGNIRTFEEQIETSSSLLTSPGVDPRYATQEAYQQYFDDVRTTAKVQADTDVVPQELVDSIGNQWVAAIDTFAKMGDAAPELTEQFIETFSSPDVQTLLRKMAPQIESDVASALSDFIVDKESSYNALYSDIAGATLAAPTFGYEGETMTTPDLKVSDAYVAVLDPKTGVVALSLKPGVPQGIKDSVDRNRAYRQQQKAWSDALTRRVQMQVTLDALASGSSDPNYERSFNKIRPYLPVTSMIQGGF